MFDLLNVVLGIIASLLSIIGYKSAKENPTKIIQKGDNNSVHIGNRKIKINIKNMFIPNQKQINKVERIIERVVVYRSESDDDLAYRIFQAILALIVVVLFGAIYMSYSFLFALILLAVFVFRFTLYTRYTIAIRAYPNVYFRSKFLICSVQRMFLFCILLSLMFFSVPQELQAVIAHTQFDLSLLKGGTTLSNWANSVIKYMRNIQYTIPFYYFLFRSIGVIVLTCGILYVTGKSVLPIYSPNIERWKALLSELCFFIFIAIVFFALYPWIFLDIKNAVEPIVIEWLRK
ncbi:hypothetical protein ABE347_06455 [Bacillus paralicheniformis]|uniref:hypothetical protein n=1 Tax=Bacillus paralicheniformis TaxID=1648923 RepID=UPI003D200D36